MRKVTVTYDVYDFDELTEYTQAKVLTRLQQRNDRKFQQETMNYVGDYIKDQLFRLGYPTTEIKFGFEETMKCSVAFYGQINLAVLVPRLTTEKQANYVAEIVDQCGLKLFVKPVRNEPMSMYVDWQLTTYANLNDVDEVVNDLKSKIEADIKHVEVSLACVVRLNWEQAISLEAASNDADQLEFSKTGEIWNEKFGQFE